MMYGQNKPSEIEIEIQSAEQEDEQGFADKAPRGMFTRKGLNNLVKATNRLLPAFEQTPDYPMFEADTEQLPTDFVRVLSMFEGAVQQAISDGVVGEDMMISLDGVSDDQALNLLAGKVTALAQNKEFKKFLKNPPAPKQEEEPSMEEQSAPQAMNTDQLFMERM